MSSHLKLGPSILRWAPLALVLVLAACLQTGPRSIAVTVTPEDGAEDVPVNAVIVADFTVDIDSTTLNGAFTLSSDEGTVAVDLDLDPSQRRATFTPSEPLAYDTEYTATVAGSLRSVDGGRLPIPTTGEYSWSFTTEVLTEVPEVTGLVVSPDLLLLDLVTPGNDTGQLTAEVTAVDGAGEEVTWSSSDDEIAEVDDTGLVTAVAGGTVTITATSVFNNTIQGQATVHVQVVTSVEVLPASADLQLGEEQQLEALVTTLGGAPETVTWSSSDDEIAEVDDTGLVTAVAGGTVTITATSVFNNTIQGQATVHVQVVTSVEVLPASADLQLGEEQQLEALVTTLGGAPETVTWSSSDDDIATVSTTGLVSAIGPGTATITATSTFDHTMADSASITVSDPWWTWETLPEAPVNIRRPAVVVDGLFHVFGGAATTPVATYDPDSGEWQTDHFPSMPATLFARCHARIGDHLYFPGGSTTVGVSHVWRLDLGTATWHQDDPLPDTLLYTAACTAYEGRLLLFGGFGPADSGPHVRQTRAWAFDPSLPEGSRWITGELAPLPVAVSEATAVHADGYIYVLAGDTGPGTEHHVQRYDPVADTWASMPTTAAPSRRGAAAWTHDQHLFVASGGTQSDTVSIEAYDLSEGLDGEWVTVDDNLPSMRRNAAVAYDTENGLIYVAGGEDHEFTTYRTAWVGTPRTPAPR